MVAPPRLPTGSMLYRRCYTGVGMADLFAGKVKLIHRVDEPISDGSDPALWCLTKVRQSALTARH